MAGPQNRSPVPARWRILFATVLVLAFMFGGLLFVRRDAVPPRKGGENGLDARIRLQTAAVAFSSGKLAPRVLILTDWPEFYRNHDAPYPEFQFFQENGKKEDEASPEVYYPHAELVVIDPASVPEFGLGGPRDVFSQFRNIHSYERFQRTFGFKKRDPDAGTLERSVKNNGAVAAKFDVVLLDCAFPDRLFSRKSLLWSSAFFDMMKENAMNSGGVFAVVLPPDRHEVSACILAFLRRSFGNMGAFCFGERVILASGLNAEPVFDLEKLSATAELAGYYDGESIPDNAIGLVLDEDYSDSIPAGLLEKAHGIAIPRVFTSFRAVFARAKYGPQLKRFLPGGFPVQTVCAWLLGILLAVYPFLRYFISWKPVHKQAFRAFEDMFYLTGVLALFMLFLHEKIRIDGASLLLYLVIPVLLWYDDDWKWSWKWTKAVVENAFGRFLMYLLAAVLFGLAFFRVVSDPLFLGLTVLVGVAFAVWPLRARMKEPVQPGPAIPFAFLLGVIVSLGLFAVSLCFPLGPVVFAAVVCAYRLILLDC
jgi:hypothetical protein